MSLFVGRLPPDFDLSELEELFEKYGKIAECKIKKGNKFAFGFVDFEDPENAETAMKEVDRMKIDGISIVVEKAKGARKENESDCFKCGERGHWARDLLAVEEIVVTVAIGIGIAVTAVTDTEIVVIAVTDTEIVVTAETDADVEVIAVINVEVEVIVVIVIDLAVDAADPPQLPRDHALYHAQEAITHLVERTVVHVHLDATPVVHVPTAVIDTQDAIVQFLENPDGQVVTVSQETIALQVITRTVLDRPEQRTIDHMNTLCLVPLYNGL
ncbi:hypothetical protein G6F70_007933 [Rhizopus microsporus]|nr:hypothetical protein G6F71_007927 [Rhizopus microsporus]KAG1195835.1 hypothetical protein G6F70_007933 [Rhizopus microsporus]KAG1206543.1 hypothetical protein G6F69_008754 [Rhizopus microsporus]KAG1226990.1 hypothetical protein G6F67_008711 [Rhizopus microsporus]KAG1260499.1 hypothetical protein G6F68_007400 [Rhizopus microsporus]